MRAPGDGDKLAIEHPRTGSQVVNVTIRAAGPQATNIQTHGLRGQPGSHILLTAGATMISIFDMIAAMTYINAWLDLANGVRPMALTESLPQTAPRRREAACSPTVSISAHGRNKVDFHTFTGAAGNTAIGVTIGTVRWVIEDRQALRSYMALWHQARELAPIVLATPRG